MTINNSNIEVFLSSSNCITPAGFSTSANINAIESSESAIKLINDIQFWADPFYASIFDNELLESKFQTLQLSNNFSKLEKLLLLAAWPVIEKNRQLINNRTGFVLSSTKGNIDSLGTDAYYMYNLAKKIALSLGFSTKPIVLSNACVSGLMAISIAKRLIQNGEFDHVFVLAGDIFSSFVFSGFQAFHAVSPKPCKPYSRHRDGISLGEGAAAAFITTKPLDNVCFEILGNSSINDANHISGPSRTGEGLFLSVEKAIQESQISRDDIDIICSHGTATEYNDEMESQAFSRSRLNHVPLYSLKGFMGHTLGAAGLIESIIALEFGQKNLIPPCLGFDELGTTEMLSVSDSLQQKQTEVILKTASGFGGSNSAIIFKKFQ